MPGLVPGIHALNPSRTKDVDGGGEDGPPAAGGGEETQPLPPPPLRTFATAAASQVSRWPGRSGTTAKPDSMRSGSSTISFAQSTHSSQWQGGVAASRCALTPRKRGDEHSMRYT